MGYDMSMVEDPNDHVALAAAQKAFDEALAIRKTLPQDEHGTVAPGGDPFEGPWVGRSERYAAAQAAVEAAMQAVDKADKGYFRLNIWGMGVCRTLMEERGMMHWEGDQVPWPKPTEHGYLNDEEFWAEQDEYSGQDRDEWPKRLVEMEDANTLCLAVSTPGVRGIPGWKLCSNDGWIVTPVDCLGALAALEDYANANGYEAAYHPRWVYPAKDANWSDRGHPGTSEEVLAEPVSWWGDWIGFLRLAAENGGFAVW